MSVFLDAGVILDSGAGFCGAPVLEMGPRVKEFHIEPIKPGFPYESWRLALLAVRSVSWAGLLNSSNRFAAEALRPVELDAELVEASEALRSASCLGPSGIAGVTKSSYTWWCWEEYFCWNGERIVGSVGW